MQIALLKGSVEFTINIGSPMKASRVLTRNLLVEAELPVYKEGEDLVAYRVNESSVSGTRFRFYVITTTGHF
jgi:hypothetical protein